MARDDVVTIEAELLLERPDSYKVMSVDTEREAFVPKSLTTYDKETWELTLPEWMATEKGLI